MVKAENDGRYFYHSINQKQAIEITVFVTEMKPFSIYLVRKSTAYVTYYIKIRCMLTLLII